MPKHWNFKDPRNLTLEDMKLFFNHIWRFKCVTTKRRNGQLVDAPYPAGNNDENVVADAPDRNLPDPSVPVIQTRKKNNAPGPHEHMVDFEGLYTLPESQLNTHSATSGPAGDNSTPNNYSPPVAPHNETFDMNSKMGNAMPGPAEESPTIEDQSPLLALHRQTCDEDIEQSPCTAPHDETFHRDMEIVDPRNIPDTEIDSSLLAPYKSPNNTLLQPERQQIVPLETIPAQQISRNGLPSIYTSPNDPPSSFNSDQDLPHMNHVVVHKDDCETMQKSDCYGEVSNTGSKETRKRKSAQTETIWPTESQKRHGPDDQAIQEAARWQVTEKRVRKPRQRNS